MLILDNYNLDEMKVLYKTLSDNTSRKFYAMYQKLQDLGMTEDEVNTWLDSLEDTTVKG